jgi:hypothetical protein
MRTVHPVTDCLLGPALGLLVSVGGLACPQLLNGKALLSGLADTRSSRLFGDPGLVEQALPVMARAFFSPRQGRGQSLPIAFALQAIGSDSRSGRGRTAPGLLLQGLARLFGDGIQLPLFLFGAQASCRGFAQGFQRILLCAAAQAQQDGQVGCHRRSGDVASGDG